jgi:hypothetical protein
MVIKLKCIDEHKALSFYQCKVGGSTKTDIGRFYGLTSWTLFTNLKNNDKIQPAVLYDGIPVIPDVSLRTST